LPPPGERAEASTRRREAGQGQGGPGARAQANGQDRDHHHDEDAVEAEIVELQMRAAIGVDHRQDQFGQGQAEQARGGGQQHGFGQELEREHPPGRAQGLAHRDLPRPHPRAGRGQVDVVDGGDDQGH
jgi:hypothetical protein